MENKPTHRLFSWLAALFGLFIMFYGMIALPQAWHWSSEGLDTGLPDEQPDIVTELHHTCHIIWHTRLVPVCLLLIISGLVILMLARSRRPKSPK